MQATHLDPVRVIVGGAPAAPPAPAHLLSRGGSRSARGDPGPAPPGASREALWSAGVRPARPPPGPPDGSCLRRRSHVRRGARDTENGTARDRSQTLRRPPGGANTSKINI